VPEPGRLGGECGSETLPLRVSEPASHWNLIHQTTMHGNMQLKEKLPLNHQEKRRDALFSPPQKIEK
jgi:hypothetical protein